MMVQIAWLTSLGFSNHQQNQYAADKAFPITETSSGIGAQVDLPGHMDSILWNSFFWSIVPQSMMQDLVLSNYILFLTALLKSS